MTQTTAVRVESILESHLHLIPLMVGVDGESADIGGMTEAARKIAAEIDALRDEMAVILRERNDAHLALAERTRERDEALAEAERLRPAAEAWRTLEDFREAERTGTLSDEKRTRKIHETARDAARAAKERNP